MLFQSLIFFNVSGILIVLGAIKASRKELGSVWLLVTGCGCFLLGVPLLFRLAA